jgi:lysophospholipase L1-like esterase
MARDMTLFKDDDGKAYLIYSSEQNNTMQVCLLSDDYLHPSKTYSRILVNRRREAPAIFKNGGKYYLITSDCSGWSPNAATYAVADRILGPYKEKGNPCTGPGANTTFQSQSSYVIRLKGKNNYLFMADRWNKTDLEKSDYLWLPLTVNKGKVEIKSADKAKVDSQTNLDFEQGLTGWKMIGDTGNFTIDKTEHHHGNYCVKIGKGYGMLKKHVDVGSLSIILFNAFIKSSQKGVKGFSFISLYNAKDQLLLTYKSNAIDSTTWQQTGNYTETPAGTKYAEIGVENNAAGKGFIYVDDFSIETNIGVPKTTHQPLCNLDQYMEPFWKSDTVYNETVLLYSANGKPAEGRLLYSPSKILAVKKFDLSKSYAPGTDYTLNGRVITRTEKSGMPFRADTSFDTKKDLAWFDIQSQWVVVTYTHSDKWSVPIPQYKGGQIPHTMAKLHAKKPVNIVAFGMSITRGMDVSSYDTIAPYMPTYVDLFARGLRKKYHDNNVKLYNAGLPGSVVDWGAQYADKYVNPLKPDLVILDFGMNDFWRLTPAQFKGYIETIIKKIKAGNPKVEFLLLSNMKFDPDYVLDSDKYKSFYQGNLEGYSHVLAQMEAKGIINLDMYAISDAVQHAKKAKDCLVNPLHPNDYMARWYAQGLTQLLIK